MRISSIIMALATVAVATPLSRLNQQFPEKATAAHDAAERKIFARKCYDLHAYCYTDLQCCSHQCDSLTHKCSEHIDPDDCPQYFDPHFEDTGCDVEKIHDPCAWGLCDSGKLDHTLGRTSKDGA